MTPDSHRLDAGAMASGGRLRAFPWPLLERTTRAEVGALRDVRRWVESHLALDRAEAVLAELLGGEVRVLVGQEVRAARNGPLDGAVSILVAPVDADGSQDALLEAEGALVAEVVARVLRRSPPVVTKAAPPGAELTGAFAAVASAALRRLGRTSVLRVPAAARAGSDPPRGASGAGTAAVLSLTVLIDRTAFRARLHLRAEACVQGSPGPTWDASRLRALGHVPLAVPVVAAAVGSNAADIASLRRGDAFVPPHEGWRLTRSRAGAAVGPVLLAPPSAPLGISAELVEAGHLVIRGRMEPIRGAEDPMDTHDTDAMINAMGDLPVLVRVEIGEAQMPARDWASLGRGDVVPLGRRVGEAVSLRIEGVVVARGELVDLEGEVAVRILERVGVRTET